ncbi:MAG: vWA domain-containing protein [Pseudomonadota bacterium]
MNTKNYLSLMLSALLACSSAAFAITNSLGSTPLLLPGKKSIFQRVLSRPEAVLYVQPGRAASAQTQATTPFSVYYVYDKKKISGKQWLHVGIDKYKGPDGWILDEQLIDWKQALIVSFKDPVGQDRVLMFRDRESLKSLVESQDLFGYHLLYSKAAAHKISPDSPVISIQPKGYVDILKDFYLVPILQHEDVYVGEEQARLLQVSTLPLNERTKSIPTNSAPKPAGSIAKDYRSGIVFVIDTTISMGPYIEQTREVVRKVYQNLETHGLRNQVNFGLIGYRDNIQSKPQLEYLTRTYATLQDGADGQSFLTNVAAVKPAQVSSRDFAEDAYAGIKAAIDDIDWDGFDARYVVLITDAGARPGHDPLAHTGMNARALRQLAYDQGLSIWVLHLKTPEGQNNHAMAAEQYKQLSYYPEIGELYYPIELGSVSGFGRALRVFTNEITNQVRAATNKVSIAPVANTQPTGNQLSDFKHKLSKLGYALRMRYLLKEEGGHIPTVFNAWMVDRDITKPDHHALEVRVLLTRDQLSDLHDVLKQVLDTAEEGVLSPRDFLSELQSLAATISRDPAAASGSTRTTGAAEKNLADLGYMREYIEDLPYTGEVMNLALETWENWSAKQQLKFLHRLESKINYYQVIHDNADLWISLDGGPVDGDSVFPIALEMLP